MTVGVSRLASNRMQCRSTNSMQPKGVFSYHCIAVEFCSAALFINISIKLFNKLSALERDRLREVLVVEVVLCKT